MSNKVKLPKAVCDALDKASVIHDECSIIFKVLECSFFNELGVLCDVDANLLMRALVLGYEPEMTAEEQLLELYKRPPTRGYEGQKRGHHEISYCGGMLDTLNVLGIRYEWMEKDAE